MSMSSATSLFWTTSSSSRICSAAVRRNVCMSCAADAEGTSAVSSASSLPPRDASSLFGVQAHLLLKHDRRLEQPEPGVLGS